MKIQAEWLQKPFVKQVVGALGAGNIRFVGGAVRDTILSRPVTDIDAATKLLPGETLTRLQTAGIKAIPTGFDHGTVTAVHDGQTLEITTLRRDMEADGRHATVAYTYDWAVDAARRDFTLNAIYAAPDGTLFDPVGGIADAKKGRVVFIGNPADRLQEDALRILRFFRFFAFYGQGKPDREAVAACTEKSFMLNQLSVERIRAELFKILSLPHPDASFSLMKKCGIFPPLKLPISMADLASTLTNEQKTGCLLPPFVRLYCAIRHKVPVKVYSVQMKLSGVEAKILLNVQMLIDGLPPKDSQACRRLIYHYGPVAVRLAAVCGGWPAAYRALAEDWLAPIFPVQGRDLLTLGFKTGPAMGKVLKGIEKQWLESDFTLTKPELLAPLSKQDASDLM